MNENCLGGITQGKGTNKMTIAEQIEAKLNDIRNNPGSHHHTYEELQACCTVDGATVGSLLHAHEGLIPDAPNGRQCDVTKGPCACGAWH
jgi:hypothetical protein